MNQHFNRDTLTPWLKIHWVGSAENDRERNVLQLGKAVIALTTYLKYCSRKGIFVGLFQFNDRKYFSMLICSGGRINLRKREYFLLIWN